MDTSLDALAALHWIDGVALLLLLVGLLFGALRGLARAALLLLYVVAILALATFAAPTVLGWFPNSAAPDDPRALGLAYGGIAGVGLLLSLVGKALAARRQGERRPTDHRLSGALFGILVAALVFTLAAPFLLGLSAQAGEPRSVVYARELGANVPALYPEYHVARLGD